MKLGSKSKDVDSFVDKLRSEGTGEDSKQYKYHDEDAQRVVLKQIQKATWKWPTDIHEKVMLLLGWICIEGISCKTIFFVQK